MKRSPLRRKPKPRKVPPRAPTGELTPLEWREAVWLRCGGCCIATGSAVPLHAMMAWSAHHAIKRQTLERRQAPAWDPRVGVVLTTDAHRKHTDRFLVIPFERLPAYVVEFAASLGPWAEDALLREHPRG